MFMFEDSEYSKWYKGDNPKLQLDAGFNLQSHRKAK